MSYLYPVFTGQSPALVTMAAPPNEEYGSEWDYKNFFWSGFGFNVAKKEERRMKTRKKTKELLGTWRRMICSVQIPLKICISYNMFPIMIAIPKHTYNLLGIQLHKICNNHNQSTICDLLLSLKTGLLPVYLNGGLVQW